MSLATEPERPDATAPDRYRTTDERRLVTVLFLDLVGFTALTESRDAEDTRELLSRYFDVCSTYIARYGGVAEKFIGDAVMAVWGSPVAREDDAERAVRAALEIVEAVGALGDQLGGPALRARAGVLTGEAAVSTAATGSGMVLGDMVNTAARIQSVADPGAVLVGEATKRATQSTVIFEDRGVHELKGKAEPVRVWQALSVVGQRDGWDLNEGLEARFVGRAADLRTIKQTFHAAADDRRPQLVSIVGQAGIGKTRLAREFGRYVDGLVEDVFWHRGRCPAYGDGLAYWALVEMIRMRCLIIEDEEASSAAAKLDQMLDATVPDAAERRWLAPRLASLLSLDDTHYADRDELFTAWSLLFQRVADQGPTVLVFEDLHQADSSLLDFIEFLVKRASGSRIYVLTLARPEMAERRPTWGTGQRAFTSLYLEGLPEEQMVAMLEDLVPGLPHKLQQAILERAQGIPLYAIETVRMLIDRGALERRAGQYVLSDPEFEPAIPETLQALVAARLDALDPADRMVVQDGSVLGRTFSKDAIAAVSGLSMSRVEDSLRTLANREILTIQTEPQSPERGQYSFLQELVRQVAYAMVPRRERKVKHLAAAQFWLDSDAPDGRDIVEVTANHLLAAYQLDPDAEDAEDIRRRAFTTLSKAADRVGAVGATVEAQGYLEMAAELASDERSRASAIERAGAMAILGDRPDDAERLLREALALYDDQLEAHAAARASAGLAEVDWRQGRLDEAVDRMEKAFAVLSEDEPDADLATLAAQLGRLHFFRGDFPAARARVETALDIAEPLAAVDTIANALLTLAAILHDRRPQQERALTSHALQLALRNDLTATALRAYNNYAELLHEADDYAAAIEAFATGIALATKVGNQFWADILRADVAFPFYMVGRWDDALEAIGCTSTNARALPEVIGWVAAIPKIHVERGAVEEATQEFALHSRYERSSSFQERSAWLSGHAVIANATGEHESALAAGLEVLDTLTALSPSSATAKLAIREALDAAWAIRDVDALRRVITGATPAHLHIQSPVVRALIAVGKGRLAIAEESGSQDSIAFYDEALAILSTTGARIWYASTADELSAWLSAAGHTDRATALRVEARQIFESAGASASLVRRAQQ